MAPGLPDAIGHYEILERIGSGGWGTVYRARDPRIGRAVAIKLLSSDFGNKDVRERFAREARFAARLSHPNIVTIYDVGEHNDMPFVAMEYIKGEALSSFLRRRPHAALASKLQIMDQLCAGLHHAHQAGMVHGDIRPANIMIDDRNVVKILDFGIARLPASTVTQTGLGLLTPNYMAPEQITGMSADGRADMFSVGAVFYELLSYRQAFPGDTSFAVMQQIVQGRPEPLGTVYPDLDPALVAIVNRCLERRPADRHPDLGAVRSALAAAGRRIQMTSDSAEREQTLTVRPRNESPRSVPPGFDFLSPDAFGRPSSDTAAGRTEAVRRHAEEADRRRERERQQRHHLEHAIAEAERRLASGALDSAVAAMKEALALDPTHSDALALKVKISAALSAAEEARHRAEQEARARQAVEDARRIFADGDHRAAQLALSRLADAHPFVAAELEALRREASEIERHRAREIDRRRAEEAERRADDAERQKLEAEVARLEHERDTARRRFEAEIERLKREAEAARINLEGEGGYLGHKAEAERWKRRAETERREAETAVPRNQAEAMPEDQPVSARALPPRTSIQAPSRSSSSSGFITASIALVGQKVRAAVFSVREMLRRPAEDPNTQPRVEAERRKRVAPEPRQVGSDSRGTARPDARAAIATDCVDCSVFAPPRARRGAAVLIQVFAHLAEATAEAAALAREFDEAAVRRAFRTLEVEIARGAILTFDLTMPGLTVDDPVQALTWRGRAESVQFAVGVPKSAAVGSVAIGTVTVSQGSVPVGHVKFTLSIDAHGPATEVSEAQATGSEAKRYQHAFASYASADRAKVLPRVQMLRAVGISCFQDVLDLNPGDQWERELCRRIDECDLFLLFWSRAARESERVMKEVDYALRRKGPSELNPPEIRPVIIEGPPIVPPPPGLVHLHFNDRVLYLIAADRAAT